MVTHDTEAQGDLIRRLEDLSSRCARSGAVTFTPFLTPAEQVTALSWMKHRCDCETLLFGGHETCERKIIFFVPEWMEDFSPEDHIAALKLEAAFGTPGHRDYMGALLGMGVKREVVGDIWVDGQAATVFCSPSVAEHLALIEQAGRVSVKASVIPLSEVSPPELKRRPVSFTVQSPRLDAVCSDLFRISRETAAKQIRLGAASLNYLPCMKPDASVKEGDVISLKGCGKAQIVSVGGQSRKGRLFVNAEIYE